MDKKIIYKPWGKEVWLELNEKYCFKTIYINANHKTSYQYHNFKLESNYIVDGIAEVWLEDENGIIDKKHLSKGDYFTVLPGKKHRMIALTDIIMQEVSTPEVEDVIRIEDDTNRPSGKIEREYFTPALCIIAAGTGTRMGIYSNQINKGLLPLQNKAVISNIIDKTPKEYDIIIAVGYKSNLIKEYCLAVHNDRNITFVDIDNYAEKGSGPGSSLLLCKKYLQRPFYIATSDCIVKDDLPIIDNNWMGVYPTSIPEIYSTANIDNQKNILGIMNKSPNGYNYALIGLWGILDYDIFWNELESTILNTGELVCAFYNVSKYNKFIAKLFNDWYDIGNLDLYIKAQIALSENEKFGISKTNGQFIYKYDNKCIKLFSYESIEHRVKRSEHIKDLIPNIIYHGKNVFSYEWITGKTLYDIDDIKIWKKFLNWCQDNLWTKENYDISNECLKFYKDKTLERLKMFEKSKPDNYFYNDYVINNLKCKNNTQKINWEELTNGIATLKYHGDLQFDNIIYDEQENNDKFYLIDWRGEFGGSNDYGDVYYDLAKLYGGILMSYKLMKDSNNYIFNKTNNDIVYRIAENENLQKFKPYYENWIIENGYDLLKIKKITALIYLNMAPLHQDNMDDLLFFHSIKLISEIYDK
jgi:dTDP-glucose pyrophosphorylase/quercetin dioxygenase-like cupin family protein